MEHGRPVIGADTFRNARSDGKFDPKQNHPGGAITTDDLATRTNARRLQRYPSASLTASEAQLAAQGLLAAANQRGWYILRAALMWNHIHVVVCHCPNDGSAVRRVLKGVSQSYINRRLKQPRGGGPLAVATVGVRRSIDRQNNRLRGKTTWQTRRNH